MITRRQLYAAQSRTALLDAAREAFTQDGFGGTNVEDITSHALLSKGAFYRHFPDKRSLFLELFVDRISEAARSIDTAVETIESARSGTGPRIAAACAYEFSARSLNDPVHRELLRQAPEVLGEQKYLEVDDDIVLPPISRLLHTLARRGELRPCVPIETTARLLLRMMCAGNTIIANATDPRAALGDIATSMLFLFSGITTPEASVAPDSADSTARNEEA